MYTPSTSRAVAGLLAFALFASACGGGTNTEDQAAIDALQAQVDELTEAASNPEPVEEVTPTTDAPPVTEAAVTETTTTTLVVEEDPELCLLYTSDAADE